MEYKELIMELFNLGKVIKNWGYVYAGLSKEWLTPKQILTFCENGQIVCSENRLVELYLSLDDSLFAFKQKIKTFIIEDGSKEILHNEDSIIRDFSFIPVQYWDLWKAEFLLRIVNSNLTTEVKLLQVADLFVVFDYPNDWKEFIYYSTAPDGIPYGNDLLYLKLNKFVNDLLKTL